MSNKPEGKESWKKKKRNLLCLKQVLSETKPIKQPNIFKIDRAGSFGTVPSSILRDYWTGNAAI